MAGAASTMHSNCCGALGTRISSNFLPVPVKASEDILRQTWQRADRHLVEFTGVREEEVVLLWLARHSFHCRLPEGRERGVGLRGVFER